MHVFLTGATGLVGGSLAGALLDAGHSVSALVRPSRDGTARDVIDMDGRDRIAEMRVLGGDVAISDFGLGEQPVAPDMLIHCAATTDFGASEAVHEAVNVGGTRHAVALAKRWGCPLLQVSTAYVCGRSEGLVSEEPADPGRAFTNGYEASKARAEALVMDAHADRLPVAIARPSIIVGRPHDGKIARIDGFHELFRLFGSPLLGPVPAVAETGFALVPIDHVAAGIMAMLDGFDAFSGRPVHLVAQQPFAMADMLRVVADYPGTYPAQMVDPDAFDPARLDRRQAMVHRRIGAHYYSYFRPSPVFCGSTLAEIAGMEPPNIDEAAFRRMVDHCIDVGFLNWR